MARVSVDMESEFPPSFPYCAVQKWGQSRLGSRLASLCATFARTQESPFSNPSELYQSAIVVDNRGALAYECCGAIAMGNVENERDVGERLNFDRPRTENRPEGTPMLAYLQGDLALCYVFGETRA